MAQYRLVEQTVEQDQFDRLVNGEDTLEVVFHSNGQKLAIAVYNKPDERKAFFDVSKE